METKKTIYDLQKRILLFVTEIISLSRKLPIDQVNKVLVSQIIRASTSIGANYEEAQAARSKKEFISIIGIVKKEAKETKYWLKVMRVSNKSSMYEEIDKVGKENEELIKIIAKILINSSS